MSCERGDRQVSPKQRDGDCVVVGVSRCVGFDDGCGKMKTRDEFGRRKTFMINDSAHQCSDGFPQGNMW